MRIKLTDAIVKSLKYSKKDNKVEYVWDESFPSFGVRLYPSGRKVYVTSFSVPTGKGKAVKRVFRKLMDCKGMPVKNARKRASMFHPERESQATKYALAALNADILAIQKKAEEERASKESEIAELRKKLEAVYRAPEAGYQ